MRSCVSRGPAYRPAPGRHGPALFHSAVIFPPATRPPLSPLGWLCRSSALAWMMTDRPTIASSVTPGTVPARWGVALCVGGQVAEVAGVVVFAVGAAVRLVGGVVVAAGLGQGGVGQVAVLVDVEAVGGVGGEAVDVGDEVEGVAVLGEGDGAGHVLVGRCGWRPRRRGRSWRWPCGPPGRRRSGAGRRRQSQGRVFMGQQ